MEIKILYKPGMSSRAIAREPETCSCFTYGWIPGLYSSTRSVIFDSRGARDINEIMEIHSLLKTVLWKWHEPISIDVTASPGLPLLGPVPAQTPSHYSSPVSPGDRCIVRSDWHAGEVQCHLNLSGRIHHGAIPGQDGIKVGAEPLALGISVRLRAVCA